MMLAVCICKPDVSERNVFTSTGESKSRIDAASAPSSSLSEVYQSFRASSFSIQMRKVCADTPFNHPKMFFSFSLSSFGSCSSVKSKPDDNTRDVRKRSCAFKTHQCDLNSCIFFTNDAFNVKCLMLLWKHLTAFILSSCFLSMNCQTSPALMFLSEYSKMNV